MTNQDGEEAGGGAGDNNKNNMRDELHIAAVITTAEMLLIFTHKYISGTTSC